MLAIWRYIFLLVFLIPQSSQARWGVGNGGDALRLAFAKSKEHAAHITLRLKERSFDSLNPNIDAGVKEWILQNQTTLASDILLSKHIWTLEKKPTCAWTFTQKPQNPELEANAANIHFSYPTCRGGIHNLSDAGQLLIHESVHHFGITDEEFADAVGLAIYSAWKNGATDWLPTSETDGPSRRWQHSAVWTGKEMIIYGGKTNKQSTILNSGYKYNPKTNQWTSISEKAAPFRYGHAAIWTGKEMIIWGGFSAQKNIETWQNSGALWNAAENKWQTLKPPFGPDATYHNLAERAAQTLVWTGKEIIIWGGATKTAALDGVIYHPETNTWHRISRRGAPFRKEGHTAVWADNKMIVWGGIDLNRNRTSEGAIYDPETNKWTQMDTQNAPRARESHAAVWTGSDMIVFGGFENSFNTNGSGGIYNPKTNSWQNLVTEVAQARRGHSVMWTGDEMLVWGGKQKRSRAYFNSVTAYNPSTKTWKAIATSHSPSSRYLHSAVWTGNSMIIFGGADRNHTFASGGQFFP